MTLKIDTKVKGIPSVGEVLVEETLMNLDSASEPRVQIILSYLQI